MNATTSVPARKPRAAKAPSTPKIRLSTPKPTGFDKAGSRGAFNAIAKALDAAFVTDEPHDWSGDSDRLLRAAAWMAETEGAQVTTGEQAQFIAYDIAAFIKAARLVPGDTESHERTTLIEAAEAHLVLLSGDSDILNVGAKRSAAPERQPTVESEEADKERRQLAADCTFEIERLAQATKTACDFGDDHPVINGIMGRIAQLSEVIYLAMRLDGGGPADRDLYDHKAMKSFYEGRLA